MYNCHLDTQPGDLGPFKRCYSVTSTERSFSPRSEKRLETSKHPLNGGSGIFLFELIGINREIIQKVGRNLSLKIKQVGYRRSKCSLPADVRWGSVVVTHSFLPHGGNNRTPTDVCGEANRSADDHIFNFEASVTSYVYEIRPKIRGPFDGC